MHRLLTIVVLVILAAASARADNAPPFQPKPLPGGRHGHRMHLVDGRLYLMGGYGGASMNACQMLDPKTGRWVDRAPMHVPQTFFASAVVGGRIYVIGGHDRKDERSAIERYDPAKDRWEVLLRTDELPRSHFSAAAVGPRIYIIGGFPDRRPHVHVFDTQTGTLADAPALPGYEKGDHFHYMAVLAGKLHVLGAMRFHPDTTVLNQHWMFDGKEWVARAPLPTESMSKLAAYGVLDGKLYLFSPSDELHHVYDPATDTWSDTPAHMPTMRVMPACVAVGKKLHVFGGVPPRERGRSAGSVMTYDAATNRWNTTR